MSRKDYPVKRGERLAAEKRKKAKVRKMVKEAWHDSEHLANNPKFVGKVAHTPHSCSDLCCGNPRRHLKGKAKLTLQEVREDIKDRENYDRASH